MFFCICDGLACSWFGGFFSKIRIMIQKPDMALDYIVLCEFQKTLVHYNPVGTDTHTFGLIARFAYESYPKTKVLKG